jgi:poly(hydroxyalkanoate) depolymerase family esterase
MKIRHHAVNVAVPGRARRLFARTNQKPRAALHRRLPAVLLCVAATAVLGALPAAAALGGTRAASARKAAHPAPHKAKRHTGKRACRTPKHGRKKHPAKAACPKPKHKPKRGQAHPGKPKPPAKSPAKNPTPAPAPLPGPGTLTTRSYSGSAGTLAYELYIPSSYKAGTAVPLVISLHGCTENADVMRQLTAWDKLAESKGFIVAFPQQSSSNNSFECWNFFQSADMQRGSGEAAMIAGITQWVQQNYSVDSKRTYVSGFSAGGAMTSVMAATYPDLYAAAGVGDGCEYAATATCAGYQSADPNSAGQQAYTAMGSHARVMPVIDFEGDQDQIVPPVNAQQLVQQWQVTDGLVMHTTVPSSATSTSYGFSPGGQSYTESVYGDGSGHELIQAWVVHGMSHAWSGGCSCEQYSDPAGPDETGAMYAFFMNHPMG